MFLFKYNFLILNINKTKKNIYILSNTKNIYSFYKKLFVHFFQYSKHLFFFFNKKNFFFLLKNYFYILEIAKKFNFFFFRKLNAHFPNKNNSLSNFIIRNTITYPNKNSVKKKFINKLLEKVFIDVDLIRKNKYYFYKYSIFINVALKDYFKNLKWKKKNKYKKKKNKNKKKIIKSRVWVYININFLKKYYSNNKKIFFDSNNIIFNYKFKFFYKYYLRKVRFYFDYFNNKCLWKIKRNYFFFKKNKKRPNQHNNFFLNYNYYRYIYFLNNYLKNNLKKIFKKNINITFNNINLLYKMSFNTEFLNYRLKWYYKFLFLKKNKLLHYNMKQKKPLFNLISNKISNIFSSNDTNIRYAFKNVYMYYFFISFKKKLTNHFFSNLFNFFFSIKKERFLLKKKLTLNLNLNSIGIIYYKNTLKNIFLTLRNFKGKHIYHISSGHLKFFGRKKVYYKNINNLTRRFLFKIQYLLLYNKIFFLKIIINGYFNDVFAFLRPFLKRYYYFSKIFYIFKNYIMFFKKYILYVKNEIKKFKQLSIINMNNYLNTISYCYYLFYYIKLKLKKNYEVNIKLLYIQVKSNKFFSN